MRSGDPGEGKYFAELNEVVRAYEEGAITLFAPIKVRIDGEIIETTAGRVIFNQAIRQNFEEDDKPVFFNSELPRRQLQRIVGYIYNKFGVSKTAKVLDSLKDLGFQVATKAGITISIDDFKVPPEKNGIIAQADAQVAEVEICTKWDFFLKRTGSLKVDWHLQSATEEMEKKVLDHLEPL